MFADGLNNGVAQPIGKHALGSLNVISTESGHDRVVIGGLTQVVSAEFVLLCGKFKPLQTAITAYNRPCCFSQVSDS